MGKVTIATPPAMQITSEITIEKIAQRAGVGKPTIYRRWKTKADVVLEAYAARAALRGAPTLPSDDAFADLQDFLERLFTVTNHPTNNRAVRCFIAESQYDADFRAKFYDVFLSKRRAAVMEIMAHGQKLGQIRADFDPDVAADAVLALCNSAATTLPRRKNAEADAAMKWVELFLLGTRKR